MPTRPPSTGFHHAVLIAAVLCAAGGVLSGLTIRDDVLAHAVDPAAVATEAGCTHSAVPTEHVRGR